MENAAGALANVLSEHDSNRVAAPEAGAVPLLVAMMRGGGGAASKAAGALTMIANETWLVLWLT